MMKIFIAVFITLVTTLKLNEARCYDPNHMEVCNDDYTKCLCKTCPSCPPGFGLNYECGGRIKASQKLKCVRCVLGTTYSDTNSSAVCLPCPQCHGHVMLRPCTRVSPTECDLKVCEEGFVWNDVVEICEHGQKIVTTPPTTTKPLTPTPVTTTPTPTSPTKPETSKAVTQKSLASIILSTIATASTTNKQPNDEAAHFHPTSSMNDQEHKKKIDIILVILVVIGAVLILASVLTGIVFCRHCQICNIGVEDGKKEEEIPLNEIQDSPQVKHNDAMSKPDQVLFEETWPSEYLLKSVPCPLREQIEIAISSVNPPVLFGWRHIGEELELDSQTLDGIEIFECQLRGAQLLKVLKAEKPRITLTLFVKTLIKCRRNDIVDKIKEFFHSK